MQRERRRNRLMGRLGRACYAQRVGNGSAPTRAEIDELVADITALNEDETIETIETDRAAAAPLPTDALVR